MTALLPAGQNLLVRVNFSDEDAWERTVNAVESAAGQTMFTIVDDGDFAGLTPDRAASALGRDDPYYLLLADKVTFQTDDLPVNVVTTAGAQLRVVPQMLAEVADNLAVGNLGLSDYEAVADDDGVLRTR